MGDYNNPASDQITDKGYFDKENVTEYDIPVFFRVVVLDVIHDPYKVTNDRLDYYKSVFGLRIADIGKTLPRNTILGRKILTRGASASEDAYFFYPFFPPHLSLPCSPGEHVWALLNHEPGVKVTHGYWICRIVEDGYVDDLNHTHAPRKLEYSYLLTEEERKRGLKPVHDLINGVPVYNKSGERRIKEDSFFIPPPRNIIPEVSPDKAYEFLLEQSDKQIGATRIVSYDAVPRYFKRPGDVVLEGSNNSLIVLGTERGGRSAAYSDVEVQINIDGSKKNAVIQSPVFPEGDIITTGTGENVGPFGSIDIVVGRGQTQDTLGSTVINSLGNRELNKVPNEIASSLREGDPDILNDRSRIRLSEKTRVDALLGGNFSLFNGSIGIEDSVGGDGAVVIKTDKLRLIARQDVEILVTSPEAGVSGTVIDSPDTTKWAAVIIKSNGDIVFRPSDAGYIKLGDDTAKKAILCTDLNATAVDGTVTAEPIFTTGSDVVGTGKSQQGTFAKKVLVT